MSSPRKNSVVDPDYEMTEIARERVRLKEDRDNKEKAEKIVEIINREFKMELDHRQSQLELIQKRLNQAQKTLHLLRYVIISSYYGDNNVPSNQTDEKVAVKEELSISNKSRIHPTIKALLGSNLNDYKFNYTKQPRKTIKLVDNQKDIIERARKSQTSESSDLSNQTMEWEETNDQLSTTNIETKPLEINKEEELDTSRNRKKGKYRVVVGNISKWMPAKSEEDKSTHKWMVYVRGSKESPDITHFVQKVVFYLHPSYQPNDVIELREAPFHLSRRGWGEFPIRVRIFFQCSLNKPVDIIHNLKLDKTFSGRQTLGNETLVNLFLYEDEKKMLPKIKTFISDDQVMIKKECYTDETENLKIEVDIQNTTQEHAMPNLEHDYCVVSSKEKGKKGVSENALLLPTSSIPIQRTYNCLTEHSYFVSNSSQYLCKSTEINLDQQETDLIYGLEEMEQKNEIIEETVLDDIKFPIKRHAQNGLQRFLISNGTVIAIKKRRKPQESLLKKMFHKKYHLNGTEMVSLLQNTRHQNPATEKAIDTLPVIDYNKYSIDFPSHKFKNVQEALPYLFKRLPIISNLATDINYKCTYPYVAKSLEEYSSWNIGKRLSTEWFQAKTILNIVTAAQLPSYKNLTVKSVIMYGRSHGYTPLSNYNIFKNKGTLSEDGLNTTPNTLSSSFRQKFPKLQVPDVIIDVINCTPDSERLSEPLYKEKFIDDKLELTGSYVKQAVLDVGIILKSENIIPGVLFNAAERMLLQGALCLAENLIRRARANLVCQGNFQEETCIIGSEEILQVLHERPEFQVLLKACTNN